MCIFIWGGFVMRILFKIVVVLGLMYVIFCECIMLWANILALRFGKEK